MSSINELIAINGHNAFENGVRAERERIIKLLWANTRTTTSPIDGAVIQSLRISPKDFDALIKGEQK